MSVVTIVLILEGNSEHVAHAWRKICLIGFLKNPICDCSQSNQMHQTDQITDFAPHVRNYFLVTI